MACALAIVRFQNFASRTLGPRQGSDLLCSSFSIAILFPQRPACPLVAETPCHPSFPLHRPRHPNTPQMPQPSHLPVHTL